MTWQHWRGFLHLSRGRYLGLHLLAGLLLSAVLASGFALVGRHIRAESWLTHFDTELGLRLEAHRKESPVCRVVLMGVTLLGSLEAMTVFIALMAIFLWCRRLLLAVVWVVVAAGSGLLNQLFKSLYDRERPPFKDPWVYEANESFPSGHSMSSLAILGFLAYLLVLRFSSRGARLAVVGGAAALILTIGFSRIYLGAHYFSDVLGGYCAGAAWLAVCISAVESVRLQRRKTENSDTKSG